jgi:hypothetical protein
VARKLLAFGVLMGAVQYRECCEWETVSFWCIYGCCTVQRMLRMAGKLLAFGVLTGVVQYRECCEWLGNC